MLKKPLIKVRNLQKDYLSGDAVSSVLKGISFDIDQGEFLAIWGPSGCGKSTLMHILGLLSRPTSGFYEFEGRNVNDYNDDELAGIRNKKVGFIFQSFNLLPKTTVLENVKLPLVYSEFRNREERVREVIDAVGLSHRINHYSGQLSGGEQQRVAIARALVNNPEIIFADEPTGNLDSKAGLQIMSILREFNAKGHTIVLVTHEYYTAEFAKSIICLKDGQVTDCGLVSKQRFTAKEKIKINESKTRK